jgi:Mitochondrial carrier protein
MTAIEEAKTKYTNGLYGLWKHYSVMLSLDIPFQVINFILFGLLSDAVLNAGYEPSIVTRLFCGITCGMVSAGLTCPLDVCKTRIIARDKAAAAAAGPIAGAAASAVQAPGIAVDAAAATAFATNGSEDGTKNDLVNLQSSMVPVNVTSPEMGPQPVPVISNNNILTEMIKIANEEGIQTLFLGLRQRLLYTGLANGIRLSTYSTSRIDIMMRSLDRI